MLGGLLALGRVPRRPLAAATAACFGFGLPGALPAAHAAGPAAGLLGARTVLGFGAVWSAVSCAFVLARPAVRMAGHEPAERHVSRGGPVGGAAPRYGGPSRG